MSNVFNKKIKLFSTNFQGDFTPLSEAKIGEDYVVRRLRTSDENARRLISVGICPDAAIMPLFAAPLGDPTAYSVAGAKIALARACARNILVCKQPVEDKSDK